MQGKVIFSSSASITSMINLKSAERLFLLLKHDTPLKLPASISQAKAASLLQSKLMAQNELTRVAMLWSRLQGELKDRASHFVAQPNPTGAKRRRENEGQNQYVDRRSTPLPPVDQISFRISCKCTGGLARYFSTQDVSKILGLSLIHI